MSMGTNCVLYAAAVLLFVISRLSDKIWQMLLKHSFYFNLDSGEQWLSGRVLDSRQRGRGFEPHWRHCVVVFEQDTFILA